MLLAAGLYPDRMGLSAPTDLLANISGGLLLLRGMEKEGG